MHNSYFYDFENITTAFFQWVRKISDLYRGLWPINKPVSPGFKLVPLE